MLLYWAVWIVFRVYFFGFLRLRIEGGEHIPRTGAFILCSNHISWLDPILLGCVLPRRIYYLAKAEAFASPFAARILRSVGAFPVRRHKADRPALRWALTLLSRGRPLAMFPEGTRSRDGAVGRAEPGAALLAVWSGRDVLPVAIGGAYRPGRLRVRFGQPFTISTGGDRARGGDLQEVADHEILGAVRRLLHQGATAPARVAVGPA